MPRGFLPAAISTTTWSVAVSITLRLPEPSLGTYANGAASAAGGMANVNTRSRRPVMNDIGCSCSNRMLVVCARDDCTNKVDAFRVVARRKPQRCPVVSRGFATTPRRERRGFMCSHLGRTPLDARARPHAREHGIVVDQRVFERHDHVPED